MAGSSLGGVIFPLMVQHLIPDIGFPWSMRICAFLIFTLLIFAILTVSSNITHKPRPISIMDYIGPLGETNFAILAVASFFMYCMCVYLAASPVMASLQELSLILMSGGDRGLIRAIR